MVKKSRKKGIRLKITKKTLITLTVIFVLLTSLCVYYTLVPKPINSVNIGGQTLPFRADLRLANNIPVYPNEEDLYLKLINPSVKNITIAFKPVGEKENPYYILQIVELIPKLYFAYSLIGLEVNFDNTPIIVESYDNITATEDNRIIALVHPVYSDETAVRVEGNIIYLKAKDYKDFDLVSAKLLMVVLGIEIES